ncbi:hypothetical protein JTB14_032234 [Gonioctena quinquepunctata]|nr:hypothetical protein JTB14_032234 [Gonioctena quinquepunctata]
MAIIGNLLAIRSIVKRNTKFLQKSCIISLALTDIFSVIIFATNNIETLSNELMVWTLGDFLCPFYTYGTSSRNNG